MPASAREGTPTAKRAQIQADVLRATEELLAEGVSFAELNVQRIALRAGISRTAFYFYFRDKREVLIRVAEQVTEELYAQADIWFSGTDAPEREIPEAVGSVAAVFRDHGPLLRAIIEVGGHDEEIGAFWRGIVERFWEATQRRVEAEQAAGNAPPMPARATAFALTWMAERSFYQQVVQGEPMPIEELVDALAGVYLRTVYGRV